MIMDWPKVIEILLSGIVSGLFGAILIFVTFRLGQWESDRKWKRELAQRVEEQIAKERNEKIIRRIIVLQDTVSALEAHMAFCNADDPKPSLEGMKVRVQAAGKAWYALAFFTQQEYPTLVQSLEDVIAVLQGTTDPSNDSPTWEENDKEREIIPAVMTTILDTIQSLEASLSTADDSPKPRGFK